MFGNSCVLLSRAKNFNCRLKLIKCEPGIATHDESNIQVLQEWQLCGKMTVTMTHFIRIKSKHVDVPHLYSKINRLNKVHNSIELNTS